MFPKFSAGLVQDYGFFACHLVFGLVVPGALPSMPTFTMTVSGVAFFVRVFFAGMATSGCGMMVVDKSVMVVGRASRWAGAGDGGRGGDGDCGEGALSGFAVTEDRMGSGMAEASRCWTYQVPPIAQLSFELQGHRSDHPAHPGHLCDQLKEVRYLGPRSSTF